MAALGTVLFTGLSTATRSGLTEAGLAAAVTESAGALITPLAARPATAAAADVARQVPGSATATAALVASAAFMLGLLTTLRIRPSVTPREPGGTPCA